MDITMAEPTQPIVYVSQPPQGRHTQMPPEPSRPVASPPETAGPAAHTQPDADAARLAADAMRLAVALRNQVVDRMRSLCVRHAQHAWERVATDPIAPHGLAFLYTDQDRKQASGYPWRIRAATRLFLDGPETVDLPGLLAVQNRIAAGYRRAGHLDARLQLANRVEAMTRTAGYFGIGVSTLDLPDRPWAQQRTSASGYDVVGRCYILLGDGTWLQLECGAPGEFSALQVWSSQTLTADAGLSTRAWNWGRHLPELADPHTRDIWLALRDLHHTLSTPENARTRP